MGGGGEEGIGGLIMNTGRGNQIIEVSLNRVAEFG
jgi:hypothetical protein